MAQVQQKLGSKNLATMVADTDHNIFENLAWEFSNAFKQLEYIVDLNAKEIFPNDTSKQDVVTNYKSCTYDLQTLSQLKSNHQELMHWEQKLSCQLYLQNMLALPMNY